MVEQIKDNPGAYIGDGGQLRLDPVRKPKWDREFIHGFLGLLVGLFALVGMLWGTSTMFWGSIATGAVITFLFLAYEITEGLRINDWAYRDIGGYLTGYTIATASWVIAGAWMHHMS